MDIVNKQREQEIESYELSMDDKIKSPPVQTDIFETSIFEQSAYQYPAELFLVLDKYDVEKNWIETS